MTSILPSGAISAGSPTLEEVFGVSRIGLIGVYFFGYFFINFVYGLITGGDSIPLFFVL